MNYVITIGRQLGSGGRQIGEAVARQLQIPCYDKDLILMASKETGLGKEFFEKVDERSSYSFFGNFFGFQPGYAGDSNYLCSETLFKLQSDVIKSLAEKGSCVFVGRCADYILREHPFTLHLFVTAPKADRIQRLCVARQIGEKEAALLIGQTDRQRAEYYNYFTSKVWGMATSYDLCVNSSTFDFDAIVRFIVENVRVTMNN
jgi:cytidylate kinase